jgi:molecular chaperone DnaK
VRGPTAPIPEAASTLPQAVAFADLLLATPGNSAVSALPVPAGPAPAPPRSGATLAMPELPPPPTSMPVPVLVDVTPRALVVETVGGWCDIVVQRNSKIPCERTRAFTTSSDGQTLVRVRVAQGEDPTFAANTFLGQLELVGLRAARRGEVTIQVRFEVDESGSLKVSATDVTTGRQAQAVLQLVGIAGTKSIEAMQARHEAAQVTGGE